MSGKSKTSIREQLEQLEALTAWFESEDFTLEEAMDKFREAEKLASEIETELNNFRHAITVLKKDFSKDS